MSNSIEEILAELSTKVRETAKGEKAYSYSALELDALEALQALITEARIDGARDFVAQLNRNHHDQPIGTPSLYVSEQLETYIKSLKKKQESR